MPNSNRILVKLLPNASLAATAPRVNLRPLHDELIAGAPTGLIKGPAWYLAELPDTAGPNPWDLAHTQVAGQLGVDESAVLFAEPDLAQHFVDDSVTRAGGLLAAAPDCTPHEQDNTHSKVTGPGFAWYLKDEFSQLKAARGAVQFADPRTRIAHIDVGYDPKHVARPEHILAAWERSFADGDDNPNTAADPGRGRAIPDNSGHGTGTIGILAGGRIAELNDDYLGGAPQADILPLRISNSVVLFHVSAFAKALLYAAQQKCDVVSISMGGLPSKAWSDAVNDAYEAGICICAAAGNCVEGEPTHHVVYPARYHRTIAVCGVMANGQPYYGIEPFDLEGNWGPPSCMTEAIAAYTPNIPWPVYHCDNLIRLNGEGTSAATPQVAAAVALWYENYKNILPRDWRRVEAVRNALFKSVKPGDKKYMGWGILQARSALDIKPNLNLPKTQPDNDSFAFLRVITGLGIASVPPREMMFNLELTQLYMTNKHLQDIIPDPEERVSEKALAEFMDAVVQDQKASIALRKHIAGRYPSIVRGGVPGADLLAPPHPACNPQVEVTQPPCRRIRTYAVDPSFSTALATASINQATLKLRWESLAPGPVGEYIEVADLDAAGQQYSPVNPDDPRLLAQDGWAPSEGNPAFHQQMVYAIAMKIIEHFERALGRPVLWRPKLNPQDDSDDTQFVQRLKIGPHALRQANAFYSPQDVALKFGYFEASEDDPGDHVPGSTVYTCLSHDIVAHETTHAILDGMYRRFDEPTNPDVLAFHEAFADIVALMQHFTLHEILEREISETRGNLEMESMLGSLAVQFGRAIGQRGALRDAIGKIEKGVWTRQKPDPTAYTKVKAPHARGALLVAAVFNAFLAIYESRIADLLRIYTRGTGILPAGAIHPDLVRRLAGEAAKTAGHVLNMCIRALDYIPPVDITFGEYLRGIITADADLVEDDRYNYRVAFVEAFRRWGIYPLDLDTLSVDTLRWQGTEIPDSKQVEVVIAQLRDYANNCFYMKDRKALFEETLRQRQALRTLLAEGFKAAPELASRVGLDPQYDFELHALRRSMRIGPDGQHVPQIIMVLVQTKQLKIDGMDQPMAYRGGSTLVIDLSHLVVQYAIKKRINSQTRIDGKTRQERTAAFLNEIAEDPLQRLMLAPPTEPFSALHLLSDVT